MQLILMHIAEGNGYSSIIACNLDGSLGDDFGELQTGKITEKSYGVSIGKCYHTCFDQQGNILVVYQEIQDLAVKIACFLPDGADLQPAFADHGIVNSVFTHDQSVEVECIRCCQDKHNNLIISAIAADKASVVISRVKYKNQYATPHIVSKKIFVDGSQALHVRDIVAVDDGSLVIALQESSAEKRDFYLMKVDSFGLLDATFNAQGLQPGIFSLSSQNANADSYVPAALLIQSTPGQYQGNILVPGFVTDCSNNTQLLMLHITGTAGTRAVQAYAQIASDDFKMFRAGGAGTYVAKKDLDSSPLISTGFGNAIYAYPSTNANAGKILVGIDNGTTSTISRFTLSGTTLTADTSFGTSGTYTIAGTLTGIESLSIDSSNNILAAGTTTGGGATAWARIINNSGTSITTCSLGASIKAAHRILQQGAAGRYIIAGDTGSAGILVGVTSAGALDSTFGSSGVYSLSSPVYSMAINSDNTILIAYKSGSVMLVSKIAANGSGLVSTFGSSGTVTTGIVPDSSSVCRVSIDASNKVIVGASTGSGANVKIQRFTSTGGTDTSWNSDGSVTTVSNLGSAGITLSNLLESTTNQTILVVYNSSGGNGALFISRLTSAGILDSTWNSTPTSPDTVGVLMYSSQSAININNGAIANDGNIISACSTNATASLSNPILTFALGSSNVGAVSQTQAQMAAGTLDYTLPSGSSGALALSGTITGVPKNCYV